MDLGRSIAVCLAAALFVAGGFAAFDRGGLLAWIGVLLGALLLLKAWRRPSPKDAVLALAALGLWLVGWAATWQYVMSTWESGEVVQIEVEGGHVARLWVLELNGEPHMYYDAPPEIARQLLAGAALSVERGGQIRQGCASAERVDDLPEARMQEALGLMEAKYADQNMATNVFYVVLGGRRDRVGLLMKLEPCG